MVEAQYREALDLAVRAAHEKHNHITEERYKEIFRDVGMNDREDKLTREYLSGIGIEFGEWDGKALKHWDCPKEEGKHLEFYLDELLELPDLGEEELLEAKKRAIEEDDAEAISLLTNHYLKSVVDIAMLYRYQAVPAEDLIGEGNIGMMTAVRALSTLDDPDEADSFVGKFIMDAMDRAIYEDTELREKQESLFPEEQEEQ